MTAESHYRHQCRVFYEDTDAGGIVYYANYLKFAERARTEALRTHGIIQSDYIKEHDGGFVVKHVDMTLHAPAQLDDLLTIHSHFTPGKGASLHVTQKIHRAEQLLTTVEVHIVHVTISTMRPKRLPAFLKEKLLPSE